jgi:hypothetical protein
MRYTAQAQKNLSYFSSPGLFHVNRNHPQFSLDRQLVALDRMWQLYVRPFLHQDQLVAGSSGTRQLAALFHNLQLSFRSTAGSFVSQLAAFFRSTAGSFGSQLSVLTFVRINSQLSRSVRPLDKQLTALELQYSGSFRYFILS